MLPWVTRKQDFSKPGWHTEPSLGYQLMFEFLRLSPSYELARKANQEGLTEDDKNRLPMDFDQVLATYKLFGNVQRMLNRAWWLKRGIKIFGNPYTKPKTQLLYNLEAGIDVGASNVVASLSSYLNDTRRSEGLGATLLVAIPLGLRRSEIHKQIDLLIGATDEVESEADLKPLITLMGKRLRTKVLFNGLRLLWFRAAKPKWEYWRLGAKAQISKTYSNTLDSSAAKKTDDSGVRYDREMMTRITYRALVKYENIAENAARGRFPSDAPVDKVDFDYLKLRKIILQKNAWEKQERIQIEEIYAKRMAIAK